MTELVLFFLVTVFFSHWNFFRAYHKSTVPLTKSFIPMIWLCGILEGLDTTFLGFQLKHFLQIDDMTLERYESFTLT